MSVEVEMCSVYDAKPLTKPPITARCQACEISSWDRLAPESWCGNRPSKNMQTVVTVMYFWNIKWWPREFWI